MMFASVRWLSRKLAALVVLAAFGFGYSKVSAYGQTLARLVKLERAEAAAKRRDRGRWGAADDPRGLGRPQYLPGAPGVHASLPASARRPSGRTTVGAPLRPAIRVPASYRP